MCLARRPDRLSLHSLISILSDDFTRFNLIPTPTTNRFVVSKRNTEYQIRCIYCPVRQTVLKKITDFQREFTVHKLLNCAQQQHNRTHRVCTAWYHRPTLYSMDEKNVCYTLDTCYLSKFVSRCVVQSAEKLANFQVERPDDRILQCCIQFTKC